MSSGLYLDSSDKRPQRGGWAPGNYRCTCSGCKIVFVGDKRAVQCADCAYSPNPILEGAAISAAILRGDDTYDPTEIPVINEPEPVAGLTDDEPTRKPEPGDIPPFFKKGLRPSLRRNLWTRFLVKMFVKKLSRTSKVGHYDPETKALVRTERIKGRSKLERKIIRYNLTHQSVPHGTH